MKCQRVRCDKAVICQCRHAPADRLPKRLGKGRMALGVRPEKVHLPHLDDKKDIGPDALPSKLR